MSVKILVMWGDVGMRSNECWGDEITEDVIAKEVRRSIVDMTRSKRDSRARRATREKLNIKSWSSQT